jgi:thioredoxin-dependent peroxiredoxin
MRRALVTFVTATVITAVITLTPAYAALAPGAAAPDFTTKAAMAGKAFQFSLASALKKGPVVLYFYPAAFTSGCTIEANQFADATEDFKKLGATVIGVSADKIETVIKAYDVKLSITGKSNRTSFVIAPDGKVIYAYSSLDYRGHVTNTLAALEQWHHAMHAKMGH